MERVTYKSVIQNAVPNILPAIHIRMHDNNGNREKITSEIQSPKKKNPE